MSVSFNEYFVLTSLHNCAHTAVLLLLLLLAQDARLRRGRRRGRSQGTARSRRSRRRCAGRRRRGRSGSAADRVAAEGELVAVAPRPVGDVAWRACLRVYRDLLLLEFDGA